MNITIPDPDRIEWILPEDCAYTVVDSSFYHLEVIFEECGDYIIGMKSYSGDTQEKSNQAEKEAESADKKAKDNPTPENQEKKGSGGQESRRRKI